MKVKHTVTVEGDWGWVPELLNRDSVVYSAGVGFNVDFDLAVIETVGCIVHAFDPTPRAIEWVKRQTLPAVFVMHEVGMAGSDKMLEMFEPEKAEYASYSSTRPNGKRKSIEVPCKRLTTLMKELGHTHVDLLKLDIEGDEYGVVDDILTDNGIVTQLAIEFHHGKDKEAVWKLLKGGFVKAYECPHSSLFVRGSV